MKKKEPRKRLKCSKCGILKARDRFRVASYCTRGRRYACKKCLKKTEVYNRPSCTECKMPRRLNINHLCMKCNRKFGLKQCKICRLLLFRLVHFNNRSKICLTCLSKDLRALALENLSPLLPHGEGQEKFQYGDAN